jgi:ABC-type antimicrobial peptide transport system permease subunit
MGIRVALGATKWELASVVLSRAARLIFVGLCSGVLGGLTASRLIGSLLYGVEPTDAVTFAGVALVLAASGLAAAIVPARRASMVDPVVAMRAE